MQHSLWLLNTTSHRSNQSSLETWLILMSINISIQCCASPLRSEGPLSWIQTTSRLSTWGRSATRAINMRNCFTCCCLVFYLFANFLTSKVYFEMQLIFKIRLPICQFRKRSKTTRVDTYACFHDCGQSRSWSKRGNSLVSTESNSLVSTESKHCCYVTPITCWHRHLHTKASGAVTACTVLHGTPCSRLYVLFPVGVDFAGHPPSHPSLFLYLGD